MLEYRRKSRQEFRQERKREQNGKPNERLKKEVQGVEKRHSFETDRRSDRQKKGAGEKRVKLRNVSICRQGLVLVSLDRFLPRINITFKRAIGGWELGGRKRR